MAQIQTDLFTRLSGKVFGWPGMYIRLTPITMKRKVAHDSLNHSQNYGGDNFEIGAFFRRNTDHFELNAYLADHTFMRNEITPLRGGTRLAAFSELFNCSLLPMRSSKLMQSEAELLLVDLIKGLAVPTP